jgi:hypothetical protein
MNMNDDEVAVVMSRKQLAMMLQALDALIDDAEWFNVIDSVNVDHGGDMINIRTVEEFDVCEEHQEQLSSSKQHLNDLEELFDLLLQSDDEFAAWARSTIASITPFLGDDND